MPPSPRRITSRASNSSSAASSHNAIEPRGCVGEYDARHGRFTLEGAIGSIHGAPAPSPRTCSKFQRTASASSRGDIGGAFGSKGTTAPENIAGAVCRAQDRPAGQMDRRAQRGVLERRSLPRQRHRCRAGARQGRAFSGAARQDARQSRRLSHRRRRRCCRPSPISARSPASIARRRSMCRCSASSPTPLRPRPIAAPAGPRRAMSSKA